MLRKDIVIVTPALADANNGNWHTAARWARMLGGDYGLRVVQEWDGGDDDDVLIGGDGKILRRWDNVASEPDMRAAVEQAIA